MYPGYIPCRCQDKAFPGMGIITVTQGHHLWVASIVLVM